jgi:uncharacterized membrane protein YedE/YeeE
MTVFTPGPAIAGGLLIGLASVLLMASIGKIAGISGIVSRLLGPSPDAALQMAFVVGLLAAAPLVRLATGAWPVQSVPSAPFLMAAAGLLVGFGATLGHGCTSGHGVCGLARLSTRSIAATLLFLVVAAATVFVARHIVGG